MQAQRTVSLNSKACACTVKNGALNGCFTVHVLFIAQAQLYHLIKMVCSSQRLFSESSALFFPLNYRGKMPSKLFNAPSKTTSMNCTYPPTTKPSKQSTHDTSKPITRNSLKRSPLFFISSSSPSLRLGHRCRHFGSLHSRVSCV